ncbi:MAG TPA: hypothetical protein VI759_10725 [Dehalococcoidia bacterium]|nr:hypothetical protein [Dehalococcoidia bacterium]
MQYVSLVAGLVLALGAAIALDGWSSLRNGAESQAHARELPAPRTTPAPIYAAASAPSTISVQLVLIRSRADLEATRQRYASADPGWITDVMVLDTPESEEYFGDYLILIGVGQLRNFRIIDLTRQ